MSFTLRKAYQKYYIEFIEILYNEAKRRNTLHPFDEVFDITIDYTINRFTGIIDKKIVNEVDYALFSKWRKQAKLIDKMIKSLNYVGYITYVKNAEEPTTFRLTEKVLTIVNPEPDETGVKNPEI